LKQKQILVFSSIQKYNRYSTSLRACEYNCIEPAAKKQKFNHYETDMEEEWKKYATDVENHDPNNLTSLFAKLENSLVSAIRWYERGVVYRSIHARTVASNTSI
jgi:hypothetical protein